MFLNSGFHESTFATKDNKPEKSEARIKAAGGFVKSVRGVPRVGEVFAVSRSVGDYSYDILQGEAKIKGMSCEPVITEFDLDSSYKFIIIASDGLWDVISNDYAVNFVKDQLEQEKDLNDIASRLIQRAIRSRDDITVLIIRFEWSFATKIKDGVNNFFDIFKK